MYLCMCGLMYVALPMSQMERKPEKGEKVVKSGYLENTFPTLVPLVTAFQASRHPDSKVLLFSSIRLMPGRTASWSSCHSRICQLLSSKQSKTNTDTGISNGKGAEYVLSKTIYDVRPMRTQEAAQMFVSMSLQV